MRLTRCPTCGRSGTTVAARPAFSKAGTKAAIVSFTRSLAKQLVDRQIRVNAVAPGPIWTPLIPASFPKEHIEQFGQGTIMGRPAEPDEIAPAYVFLASGDGAAMTGQVLHPNGGDIVGG